MIPRHVQVVVCDECFVSMQGKYTLWGVYTTDLTVASEENRVAQLVFFFMVEGDIEHPPRSLALEVTLPGEKPFQQTMPILGEFPKQPGRTRWTAKIPFPIIGAMLRPGKIETKMIVDGDEVIGPSYWIVQNASPAKA